MRNSNAPEFRGGLTSGRVASARCSGAALGVADLPRQAPVPCLPLRAAACALIIAATELIPTDGIVKATANSVVTVAGVDLELAREISI